VRRLKGRYAQGIALGSGRMCATHVSSTGTLSAVRDEGSNICSAEPAKPSWVKEGLEHGESGRCALSGSYGLLGKDHVIIEPEDNAALREHTKRTVFARGIPDFSLAVLMKHGSIQSLEDIQRQLPPYARRSSAWRGYSGRTHTRAGRRHKSSTGTLGGIRQDECGGNALLLYPIVRLAGTFRGMSTDPLRLEARAILIAGHRI